MDIWDCQLMIKKKIDPFMVIFQVSIKIHFWHRWKSTLTLGNLPILYNMVKVSEGPCSALQSCKILQTPLCRCGSRINTDQFPKWAAKAQASRGVRRRAPPGNFLDFHSLKSPFLDFIVIQTGYWPDSNLESVFIIKNIFVMKNVTDFRKTVETGVDPCLLC